MKLKKGIFHVDESTVAPNGGLGYFPEDIRRAYNIPANYTGKGQTIGILEFSNGYNLKDATMFWNSHNITPPVVKFVSVDGATNDDGASENDVECTLDLQWAGAIAPEATIVVYEANAGSTYAEFAQAVLKTFNYVLNDDVNKPSVISISYGDAEIATFDVQTVKDWSNLVAQLDAKGITVCVASGDQGAYGMHDTGGKLVPHADAPATIPAAVAVGGTALYTNGTETAWTYNSAADGGATGGGYSAIFPVPSYQVNVPTITGTGRAIPDLAFNADPATGYEIVFKDQAFPVGGTSVACPVFAGIVALANEARAQNNLPTITGLTQWLYTNYDKGFFKDITVGNNTYGGVTGYSAGPGWDATTGWGSMDVTKFIETIAKVTIAPTPTPIVKHNYSVKVGWDKDVYTVGETGSFWAGTYDNDNPVPTVYPMCPSVKLSDGEDGPVPTFLPDGKGGVPWGTTNPGVYTATATWVTPDGTTVTASAKSTWLAKPTPAPKPIKQPTVFEAVVDFFKNIIKAIFG